LQSNAATIQINSIAIWSTPLEQESWIEQALAEAYQTAEAEIEAEKKVKLLIPPEFRGSSRVLFSSRDKEQIISGPAGTGKSFACLWKLHYLAATKKDLRLAIVRKTRESLNESALVTYEQQVIGGTDYAYLADGPKRESRHTYDYPTGSQISIFGLTQSNRDQRAKIMSTEFDVIYVQEAIELQLDDWEKVTTRLRHGALPYQQIIGDTNPDSPLHWIWSRQLSGRLSFLNSVHEDNPRLYDAKSKTWTPYGTEYLERLNRLTGVMRDRFRDGKWVQASGLIYGDVWDENNGSVTEAAEYEPNAGNVVWACDDGYSAGSAPHTRGIDPITGFYVGDAHPRVILFCQLKPDGHVDIFDESYACLKLSNEHIAEALKRDYPEPDWAAHGPGAAEIRGRFFEAGITPRQCTAKVDESIKELRGALATDANGWRRVRVHPRCRNLRAEMSAYVYETGGEVPVKQFDHGEDAARGLIWLLRWEK
jgi:hypothetical protein